MLYYFIISVFSFSINVPFGAIRTNYPKYSFKWLLWIHASIPLIIYVRSILEISSYFIPLTIAFAIYGQIIGAKWKISRLTEQDIKKAKQLPDIEEINPKSINPKEVLIALLNMGGPIKSKDIPLFQKYIFEDSKLIRLPLSFLFQKLFAKLIVKIRTKEVQENYDILGGGSPIYKSTIAQTQALKDKLKEKGMNSDIVFSFNYSPPYPRNTIMTAKKKKKKYLLPLSLYPHYSSATTGSNLHYLKMAKDKNYPALEFLPVPKYYLHNGYIQAFVDRIQEAIKPTESLDDYYIIFSAHGLPMYFLTEGDPYPFQISQTVSKVLSKLDRTKNWSLAYQSSVGPLEWMKPSTDDTLELLAKKKIKKVLMVPIAFVSDHIETIVEINMEYRELAEKAGITDYRMSKAIETHPGFIDALADSVIESLNFDKTNNENLNNNKKQLVTN